MSLELQFRALYRLYYKRDEREAFLRDGRPPVAGMDAATLAPLRALEPARLRRVVDLHARDIARQWYVPRVPAAWLALQALFEAPEDEVVHLVTGSGTFESRVNDDSDCRALAGFVDALGEKLREMPWLPDLVRYERLLGCEWPGGPRTRIEHFSFDVTGIRESLVRDRICPTDERRRHTWLLLHRAHREVRELAISPNDSEVIAALVAGRRAKADERKLKRCRKLLRDLEG